MGFFDSKSSSDQENAQNTQGQEVQDTGTAFAASNIKTGKNSSVNITANIEQTDFGAIEAAGDLARAAEGIASQGGAALAAISSDLERSNQALVDGSVDVAREGVYVATAGLDLAGDLGQMVFDESQGNRDFLRDVSADNRDLLGEFIDATGDQLAEAFGFAERSQREANQAAERRAASADARADRALATASQTFDSALFGLERAGAANQSLVRDVAGFQAELVDDVLGQVSDNSAEQFAALGTFVERNTQISDQRVTDFAKFAVGGVVAALVIPQLIKRA